VDLYNTTLEKKKNVELYPGCICDACGQVITDKHVEKCIDEVKEHNLILEKDLNDIQEQGREARLKQNEIESKLNEIKVSLEKVIEQRKQMTHENNSIQVKYKKNYDQETQIIDKENEEITEKFNELLEKETSK